MKIELHILQNFAPSNLNRDDTGAPKDCELGGHRRARISSQCQKRAVREAFRIDGLLANEELGARTKRLVHEVASKLEERGMQREEAAGLALGAITGIGLGTNKKGSGEDLWKTEYLLFVPRRVADRLADLLYTHRATLAPLAAATTPAEAAEAADAGAKPKKSAKKDAKKEAKASYPKEIREEVEGLLEGARSTADLALFGRMIADKADWNVDAACQVAHAISTNRVQMDFDFFTAVDDFKPRDTAGSDMMGTIQFNSSCFYRYAVLDVDALRRNLDQKEGGAKLLEKTVDAFLRAFVSAIPTGKQNGMAAHNFPSYALAVVRDGGQPISLANAFLKPARPDDGKNKDLVDDSIEKLERYYQNLREALGKSKLSVTWADDSERPRTADVTRSEGLHDFFTQIVACSVGASA